MPTGGIRTRTSGIMIPAFVAPAASQFSPLDLPGLIAWYDASSTGVYSNTGTSTSVDSSAVKQWNDLSGNNFHLSAITDVGPVYQSAGFNGTHTCMFESSNGRFMTTNITGQIVTMGTGTTGSAFFVGQMLTDTPNSGRAVSYQGNGQTSDGAVAGSAAWILREGTNNGVTSFRTTFYASASINLAQNYRIGNIYDGTDNTFYINNSSGTAVAATPAWTSPGDITISSVLNNGYNSGWSGPISEIVVTNTALSSDDRLSLDNYFKSKWGL